MRSATLPLSLLIVLSLTAPAPSQITLEPIGRYATGIYNQVAAEIGAHDPETQRLFVTNSATNTVDVLDMSDPGALSLLFTIPLTEHGVGPSSVAFKNGLGAVAVESDPKTDPGKVVFFTADGTVIASVVAGALPDSLQFTPDGRRLVVANEGEPSEDYTVDPEGSISIIDIPPGGGLITQANVRTADFTAFNSQKERLIDRGVRIYGPKIEVVIGEGGMEEHVVTDGGATVAQDLEPEYVTISPSSRTAWVTLQEANAIAVVDLEDARIQKILPLGFKMHLLKKNALDASDRDDETNIRAWPVRGMYLPDAIATFRVGEKNYLVTANEGDTRDWEGFSEEERIADLLLDGPLSRIRDLQENENLGRLKVTNSPPSGKEPGEGEEGEDLYTRLHSFGGRSFSIWSTEGDLVFDSGSELERIISRRLGADFNSDHIASPSGDSRSDDKGPEPEAVAVGAVGSKIYAFIGLERVGGIVIYDITKPRNPRFVDYVNHRDFMVTFNVEDCAACADDCTGDCVGECEDCKAACLACDECPEGEDCTEECALCEECEPRFEGCPDCSPECPVIAGCIEPCTTECIAENCPQPGVEGRDPLDLGPEGLFFIPKDASPPGFGPLVVLTNEVSGSTTVFQVKVTKNGKGGDKDDDDDEDGDD